MAETFREELERKLEMLIEQCQEHEYALWGVDPGAAGQSIAVSEAVEILDRLKRRIPRHEI